MALLISNTRLTLLCIAWVAALIQVLSNTPLANAEFTNFSNIAVINVGVFAFIGFTILTVTRLRRDSILILALLIFFVIKLLNLFDSIPIVDSIERKIINAIKHKYMRVENIILIIFF